ncbi:MAG: hypothetical protein ACRDL4_16085, partial [Thermoleophilaceae bacterium]
PAPLGAPAPAAAEAAKRPRLPADFLGVTSEDAFSGTDEWRDKAFRDQAAAGVRLVRQRTAKRLGWSRGR